MHIANKMTRPRLLSVSITLFVLVLGILIGTLINTNVKAARGQATAPDATPLTIPPIHKLDNEFVKIAKAIEPSVVYISTDWKPKQVSNKKRGAPQGDDQGDDEDPSAGGDLGSSGSVARGWGA